MSVEWPSTLPNCLESWQEVERPTVIRTDMESGPPKVRRRFTAPMREIRVSMNMDKAQYLTFRDFYDNEALQGVEWFTFTHPYTGLVEEFRFVEPPNIQNNGALALTLSMTWEQLPDAGPIPAPG